MRPTQYLMPFAVSMTCVLALAACGIKGGLYLPASTPNAPGPAPVAAPAPAAPIPTPDHKPSTAASAPSAQSSAKSSS